MPNGLTALMSAKRVGKEVGENNTTWKFSQDIPIASYLIALVVGCLENRSASTSLARVLSDALIGMPPGKLDHVLWSGLKRKWLSKQPGNSLKYVLVDIRISFI